MSTCESEFAKTHQQHAVHTGGVKRRDDKDKECSIKKGIA